jgi:hypothetical protein
VTRRRRAQNLAADRYGDVWGVHEDDTARGGVGFKTGDLKVPLKDGDAVPCPKCQGRHFVKTDPRPGLRYSSERGGVDKVPNTVLFIECPDEPGPIVVGMDGFALPQPLALTPRKQGQ